MGRHKKFCACDKCLAKKEQKDEQELPSKEEALSIIRASELPDTIITAGED